MNTVKILFYDFFKIRSKIQFKNGFKGSKIVILLFKITLY